MRIGETIGAILLALACISVLFLCVVGVWLFRVIVIVWILRVLGVV